MFSVVIESDGLFAVQMINVVEVCVAADQGVVVEEIKDSKGLCD